MGCNWEKVKETLRNYEDFGKMLNLENPYQEDKRYDPPHLYGYTSPGGTASGAPDHKRSENPARNPPEESKVHICQ